MSERASGVRILPPPQSMDEKPKVIVVLPAYNAAKTLEKTVADIPKEFVDEIILVDDGSHDETIRVAESLALTVITHDKNRGYGANQKTCYEAALAHGADIVVMLHPDYQYDPKLIPHFVGLIRDGYFDIVLGSRIRSRGETLAGGMPAYKYYANRFLTFIENLASGYDLSEWHTGMRAYTREVLAQIDFSSNSDDFVFDTQVLFQAVEEKYRIGEIPVPVRYFPEASSINFSRSIKYGLQTLGVALRHWLAARTYAAYAVICGVGVLLYAKSFFFGFTYLDDHVLILDNLAALEDFWYLFGAFADGVFAAAQDTTLYYRPLLTISFIPEAIVDGAMPLFYHLVNVGIHLVAACLVYALFAKLTYSKRISLFAGLVFVVHPALTQAVAWIPGRNDSLLAVFVLASFIYLLDFIGTNAEGKQKALRWSVFFFTLALFTKETAIVLPFLCVGYLFIRGAMNKSTLLQLSAGWGLSLALYFPLRLLIMGEALAMPLRDIVFGFIKNVPGTLPLLGKVFFPFNLSVLPILQDTTFLWGYLAIALMTAVVFWQVRKRQTSRHTYCMMLFGLAWFLLFLWPSFVRPDISGTADFIEHRLYVPIIGLLIFIAESRVGWYFNAMHYERSLLALPIVFLYLGITFVHQDVFANRLVFWQNAASHSPHSPLAQKNLGAMQYLDQNYSLAEEYSRRALALNPKETMAHNNLGLIYAARGEWAEAEEEYRQEILINPFYDDVYYNFGLLRYQMGDSAAARQEWEKALAVNPRHGGARQALQVLQRGGR
ncbi:MAG: glycosyltransferase [Candidatus Paceibacterota bacterium]